MMKQKSQEHGKSPKIISIISWLSIFYLSIKLIVFPVIFPIYSIINHSEGESFENNDFSDITIPDITFSDIGLIAVVLLCQPVMAELFKSLKISKDGFEAEFREFKEQVKEEIDMLQQQQIDELNLMQAFMFGLLLTSTEYEKVLDLKRHSEAGNSYTFYVGRDAARELRRLRDFDLIKTKDNRYISSLEKESDYGKKAIDLTQYCEVTDLGKQFLNVKQKLKNTEVKPDLEDI